MRVSDTKKNRGAHGDSSFKLGGLPSSSENPPASAVGSVKSITPSVFLDAADAIEVIPKMEKAIRWIPVTERLPECDLGAEVGNIEWISCGMVHSGCFGRGGKYRDAYFRTWTDAGEGMDAKDADYWRAVTLPEPPKEE